MFRLHHLLASLALVSAFVALAAAPAAAQVPATSIGDQLQQQALRDAVQAQQEAVLRSLAPGRSGAAALAASTSLPRLGPWALEDSVARYTTMQRQSRRWSHPLLVIGAAAVASGFAGQLSAGSSAGLSELLRALVVGGFGLTVIGSQQRKAAASARVQAEQWRSLQRLAAAQQVRR